MNSRDKKKGQRAGGKSKTRTYRPGFLPPLSALPERFAGSACAVAACRLRVAPSVDCIGCSLSPVGIRSSVFQLQNVCQSFCLSVQTAVISSSAPSAATSKGGSLLNGGNSNCLRWSTIATATRLRAIAFTPEPEGPGVTPCNGGGCQQLFGGFVSCVWGIAGLDAAASKRTFVSTRDCAAHALRVPGIHPRGM